MGEAAGDTGAPLRDGAGVLRRHNVTVSGATAGEAATVVLGHGFATDQRIWRRIRPWLDRRFRTVAFDMAGCGGAAPDSHDPIRHATPGGHADDLLAILDALGIARCVYLGHDAGAMAGALAAVEAPQRFERMVLLAPSPCLVTRRGYRAGLPPQAAQAIVGAMTANYAAWAREFAALAVGGAPGCAAAVEVANCLSALRPDVAFQQAVAVFQADLRGWIDGLAVPAAIVHAQGDPLVPLDAVCHLQRVWPAAALEVLPVGGHLPHLTAPDRVISVLVRHLKGVAAA